MTHTDAVAASSLNFAIRPSMLFGADEQFLIGSEASSRYYRLQVTNASCFNDWEPLETREPLETLRKNYPYVVIPEPVEPVQGQRVQGQKVHGRKAKT
jgi:hypothetical protein